MIHHLSIPAQNPRHVATVLTEIFAGTLTGFGPYQNSYIAWQGDEHGSAIEVYPVGTEMFPHTGQGQAQFRASTHPSAFTSTHAAVSVKITQQDIFAIAERCGWRAIELSRGSNMVIAFWIENAVMLELMTEEMTADYVRAASVFRKS
jgi:hypothetical protein